MTKGEGNAEWDAVVAAPLGKIFVDRFEDGLRFVILRGPCSICAYVGVPSDHPLAGVSYDDLPVSAHGGLTYASAGGSDRNFLPEGYYWWGWDYAHCDDYATHYDDPKIAHIFKGDHHATETRWTPSLVEQDSYSAIRDFKHILKIAEHCATRQPKESHA